MYTNSGYSTSNEFAIGFLAGVTYTANFLGKIQYDFSAIESQEIINDYDYYDEINFEDIQLDSISDGVIELKLNWPLTVRVEKQGDIYLASNIDFNVHEIGDSKMDVIHKFQSTFIHFWNYYKDIDDNQLIGFAKRLKALFSSIVKE